ncbi:condensation domain-containing protein, partial [Sinomicrobium oceani]|uniref:condensation domain-containing protein n=1 Tax=Sinomicrobium oceani TaxID=1150368 RepID=UPI00227D31F1
KGEAYDRLKAFSLKEGLTVNAIVQFGWHKLLQTYSNNMQSMVGTIISGRDLPIEGIENSVGLFINTLPLVIDWDNNDPVKVQLQQVQKRITALNSNSFADLAKLQKNGQRLFHSLLIFENYPLPKSGGNKTLKVSLRNAIEKVDYPLNLLAYEHDGSLSFQ